MKTLYLITFSMLLFFTAQATTFRINNNLATDKSKGIYAGLQEAHDDINVAAGDTLYVEGSVKSYAKLTSVKRLIIIGPGYFLSENNTTQSNGIPAIILGIGLQNGSQGTVLAGLQFGTGSSAYAPEIGVSAVLIYRCYIPQGIYIYGIIDGLTIIQNYFNNSSIYIGSTAYSFTNLVLKNNVINNIQTPNLISYPRQFSVVENNIFLGNVELSSLVFRNNILVDKNATYKITSANLQNNLYFGTQLNNTAGNNIMVDESKLFTGITSTNKSPDSQYKLKK